MFNANETVWQWLKAEAKGHELYPYTRPHRALSFDNSDHMMREVTRSGSHYFTRETMRVFKCRTYELVSSRFLIVSDVCPDGRIYRVAYATDPRSATMISMEQSSHMASLSQARGFVRELVRLLDIVDEPELTRRVAEHQGR